MESREEYIQSILEGLSEQEIVLLFDNVNAYRKTSVTMLDCPLDRLTQNIQSQFQDSYENTVIEVMDQLLYMIAGNFAGELAGYYEAEFCNWKAKGDTDVYIVHNLRKPALWDFCVMTKDELCLAYFKDEISAKKYVASHGFKSPTVTIMTTDEFS